MMKKIIFKMTIITAIAGMILLSNSCKKDLLDQLPTTQLASDAFWKTDQDADYALNGLYASVRPCFDRDYYYDGQGEYLNVRGTSANANSNSNVDVKLRFGDAYSGSNNDFLTSGYGGGFDKMFKYLYGGVNRANYVIENVNKMIEAATTDASRTKLKSVVGEAKMLRALCYFRLISLWGDVPYIGNVVNANDEVTAIARTPIAVVKDSIIADLTYAATYLPAKPAVLGRTAQSAALALRGKVQLYWACWNKNGWPELDTFTPSKVEADSAYARAARDFNTVITSSKYGLTLFRNGDPGNWGTMGKADVLPNYFDLFTPAANLDPELMLGFTHGEITQYVGQGEELMRDFGGRGLENSQCWATPCYELADRYQSTVTGDFFPPMVPGGTATTVNSPLNPASYVDRDYRMKATLLWDNEQIIGLTSLQSKGFMVYKYGSTSGNDVATGLPYYRFDGSTDQRIGYGTRKFMRNTPGLDRSSGNYKWPVIRLADVYLMYAEATNEIYGPQADAIALVNKVRRRGNLPALAAAKTADKTVFFSAIEQERIVELFAEGHRAFDLRRWRAIERVFGAPYSLGIQRVDTRAANVGTRIFQNQSELTYQKCYIFKIPASERDKNPKLTQNKPWL
jgi:hypothetical protein